MAGKACPGRTGEGEARQFLVSRWPQTGTLTSAEGSRSAFAQTDTCEMRVSRTNGLEIVLCVYLAPPFS